MELGTRYSVPSMKGLHEHSALQCMARTNSCYCSRDVVSCEVVDGCGCDRAVMSHKTILALSI
jgi:hypothetical protein